jgi:hypothetical protein
VTALNMVFMYTINSLKYEWWDEVTLLIWGGATHLSSEDADVQAIIRQAQEAGIHVIACKKCAENLGVVETLEALGVEVFYTGTLLSEWLQSGVKLLTI